MRARCDFRAIETKESKIGNTLRGLRRYSNASVRGFDPRTRNPNSSYDSSYHRLFPKVRATSQVLDTFGPPPMYIDTRTHTRTHRQGLSALCILSLYVVCVGRYSHDPTEMIFTKRVAFIRMHSARQCLLRVAPKVHIISG